jgi:hypothetical protein
MMAKTQIKKVNIEFRDINTFSLINCFLNTKPKDIIEKKETPILI